MAEKNNQDATKLLFKLVKALENCGQPRDEEWGQCQICGQTVDNGRDHAPSCPFRQARDFFEYKRITICVDNEERPLTFEADGLQYAWPIIYFDLDMGISHLEEWDPEEAADMAIGWAFAGWMFGRDDGYPDGFEDVLRILERYAGEPAGAFNDLEYVEQLSADSFQRMYGGISKLVNH
ncbi:hypothetical protein [Oceanidesulfovibrio marinus]|nr:hypothetical protein [Oceanidesulfovibrio marinus]